MNKYKKVYDFRKKVIDKIKENRNNILGIRKYYKDHPIEFINHWCDTYNPRLASKDKMQSIPLILFKRQEELVQFIHAMIINETNGLIEKSRDMGVTWICCGLSVWLFLFWHGTSVGWGSRKEQYVDSSSVPDSIFEKMRIILRYLPSGIRPREYNERKHATFMKIINPETGASITGESGASIGRGGRKLIYFKDESAYYEHPEKTEAALNDNTNIQIDISSVNGVGNVFHRKREAGITWTVGKKPSDLTNVFIMDWSSHPDKTKEWYNKRKKKAESDGLLHLFAQEVDRNYAAAIKGRIIPYDWIISSIDAHIKLKFVDSKQWYAALDVAASTGDKNAFAARRGSVLLDLEEWNEKDTGVTAKKASYLCQGKGYVELQYDCIGIGQGVKSESNRLKNTELMKDIVFVKWNAGESPQDKREHVIYGDTQSPLNGEFYANLKAQGWWELRRRFERTHRSITQGESYPDSDLISISSDTNHLMELQKQLLQPILGKSSKYKLVVDKQPHGETSPNLADAVMMAYFPMKVNNVGVMDVSMLDI